jgi:hypothetical protein
MSEQRFLLPPGLDSEAQNEELMKLFREHPTATLGWIADVYPRNVAGLSSRAIPTGFLRRHQHALADAAPRRGRAGIKDWGRHL